LSFSHYETADPLFQKYRGPRKEKAGPDPI
jgi:hypothetical protein